MRTAQRILFSVFSASLVPAVLFTLVSSILDSGFYGWAVIIFPFVLLTTFSHTLFLGVPLFLLLRKLSCVHLWSMAALGFFVGALPIPISGALMSWLRNGADIGWDEFIKGFFSAGVVGAIGGLAFFLTWKRSNRLDEHRAP